jgi:YggT family protein
MQHQRIPFGNPVGRFVFALTDWIVSAAAQVAPGYKRWDFSSLVAAYLFELAQFAIIALMIGRGAAAIPMLALFGLVRLLISGAVGLTIVYAILSWVNADSPMTDVIDRLAARCCGRSGA